MNKIKALLIACAALLATGSAWAQSADNVVDLERRQISLVNTPLSPITLDNQHEVLGDIVADTDVTEILSSISTQSGAWAAVYRITSKSNAKRLILATYYANGKRSGVAELGRTSDEVALAQIAYDSKPTTKFDVTATIGDCQLTAKRHFEHLMRAPGSGELMPVATVDATITYHWAEDGTMLPADGIEVNTSGQVDREFADVLTTFSMPVGNDELTDLAYAAAATKFNILVGATPTPQAPGYVAQKAGNIYTQNPNEVLRYIAANPDATLNLIFLEQLIKTNSIDFADVLARIKKMKDKKAKKFYKKWLKENFGVKKL